MALNPLIALQAGTPDISPAVDRFANTVQKNRDRDLNKRRLGILEGREERKAAQAKLEGLEATEKRRVKNNIVDSLRARAAFDAGGQPALERLIVQNRERNAAAGIDSRETDEIAALVSSGNIDQALAMFDQSIEIGERLGLIKEGKATETFEDVIGADGAVIAQRNVATKRVVDDPRAPAQRASKLLTPEEMDQALEMTEAKEGIKAESAENLARIKASISQNSAKGEAPSRTDISGMRKEFTSLSKPFIQTRDSFKRIQAAGQTPSAAGDLALIFNFMKMLDPGSVVRESEFATAQNAAGVPDRIRAQFNRIQSGERMAPAQRKDFLEQATNLFASQISTQRAREREFSRIATDTGITPTDVVVDLLGEFRARGITGNLTAEEQSELSQLRKELGATQ